MIGRTLGDYRIVEKLGAGGMGVVYKARDQHLDRFVAIKLLPPEKVANPDRKRRFVQEAKAASALHHSNIVHIYDISSDEGMDFIAMEFVDGKTLDHRISHRSLPLGDALKYGVQIADALAKAHSTGIVHRDLKPSNLIVNEEGVLKILDFGLAKLTEQIQGDGFASTATVDGGERPVTEKGAIVGTVAYMSPEQAEGKPVDARSDIFSFGSVLYEMVTGRKAFQGDSKISTLAAILREEPAPVSRVSGGIPQELERVITRCLRKDPVRRFQHMDDVKIALEELKEESDSGKSASQPAVVPSKPWISKRLMAGIAVAVMLIAAGIGVWLWKGRIAAKGPSLDPKRVVVAIFENRTGDPSLDYLGKTAAESITEGLSGIGAVEVLPSSSVLHIAAAGAEARPGRDPIRALAEATRSGLVLSGAYYVEGRTLQIQAKITDAGANKLLYAVEPGNSPREKPLEAVEAVRRRVMDVIAAWYLSPKFDMLSEETKPPRYEAYKEFLIGMELLMSDPPAAVTCFERALQLDPDFVSPRIRLVTTLSNQAKLAEAEEQLNTIGKRQELLTPLNRRRMEWWRANVAGHPDEMLSASRDIVELAPGSVADGGNLAFAAHLANRPRETVEALGRPLQWELLVRPANPFSSVFFFLLTGALHQLGEHGKELEEARRGRSVYPDLLVVRTFEVRALVALGRLDEVDKLVAEVLAMSSSRWGLFNIGPRGSPGLVMSAAAEELRAHGWREASLKMAGRAADWFRNRPGEEARQEQTRSELGASLYQAERWDEARAALATEHPEKIDYKGYLGTLAVRQGDRAEAQRISEELRLIQRPYLYGSQIWWRARIAALLGDKGGAVALLREAVAQGLGSAESEAYGYGFIYRHRMDLEPLYAYPPFEELIKPKG